VIDHAAVVAKEYRAEAYRLSALLERCDIDVVNICTQAVCIRKWQSKRCSGKQSSSKTDGDEFVYAIVYRNRQATGQVCVILQNRYNPMRLRASWTKETGQVLLGNATVRCSSQNITRRLARYVCAGAAALMINPFIILRMRVDWHVESGSRTATLAHRMERKFGVLQSVQVWRARHN